MRLDSPSLIVLYLAVRFQVSRFSSVRGLPRLPAYVHHCGRENGGRCIRRDKAVQARGQLELVLACLLLVRRVRVRVPEGLHAGLASAMFPAE